MRERSEELEALNVDVYAVTFESRSRIQEFLGDEPLPFPVLRDPGREAYRLFGLGRRPVTTIWGPQTLWYYGRRLLQGELPKRSGGSDRYQLGGDVIVRGDWSGGWIYRSRNPSDRPAVDEVLKVVERETAG